MDQQLESFLRDSIHSFCTPGPDTLNTFAGATAAVGAAVAAFRLTQNPIVTAVVAGAVAAFGAYTGACLDVAASQ